MTSTEYIKTITVVGAGTMGHGIAEVAALSGFKVYLADISTDILSNALGKIKWSLSKLSEKGQLRESVDNIMSRIIPVVNIENGQYTKEFASAISQSDFVIEAIPERIDLKQQLFRFLDENAPQHAILATNTSSLPISEIAAVTKRPEKVVGMHFFNPPPLMPLVEIIKGDKTDDEVVKTVYDLAKKFGKQPVVVKKDVPGFIVNRILGRFLNEACWMVARGKASVTEVDSAVKYRLGFPMGAFELADYSGIDVFHLVFIAMVQRGMKMTGCPLFKEKFDKKEYGMKTGKGFYEYPAPGKYVRPNIPKEAGEKVDIVALMAPAINEAAWLLENDIATMEDIDKAVMLGLGWPKGVFEYADELGIDSVVNALKKLKEETGLEEYEPNALLTRMVQEGKLGRKSGRGFREYRPVEEIAKKTLLIRLEKPIAWIVLNRPDKYNAINYELLKELSDTLDELELNNEIRVIVITGAGRVFSAGADVSSFVGITPVKAAIFSRKFQEVNLKIEYYTKPVIAALNGYTLGGGLEIAMSTDFRIASETAMLGQPEIKLGIIPGAGGTQRLARLIGISKAKQLIFTGEYIPAGEALKLGLVDKVVPPERLEDEVRTFALKLSEMPPLAIMLAKYAVNYGLESNIWTGLALESSSFGLLFSTEDVAEGVSAFFEKRKPKFKGQ